MAFTTRCEKSGKINMLILCRILLTDVTRALGFISANNLKV